MAGSRRTWAAHPASGLPNADPPRPAQTGDLADPARSVTGRAPAVEPPRGMGERVWITLTGIRQPIVAILLIISIFTVLSGKPVDGLLLFSVATALAWDAGMRVRQTAAIRRDAPDAAGTGPDGAGARESPGSPDPGMTVQASAWRLRTTRPRLRFIAVGVVAAVIYSLVVGSFTRYSWPATAGIVGLGASAVSIGWGGPTRQREVVGRLSRKAVLVWGSLLVAAGLWELAALLGQPNLETSSYDHPTISTLTDPLLSSSLGRSFALLAWIGLGAFLVER
ncbi:MAG: hypothetical protein ACYCU3_17820 [Streptosporangiaceae bacterium]